MTVSGHNIRTFSNAGALSAAGAEFCTAAIRAAIQDRGVSYVALSGGQTPRELYAHISAPPLSASVEWSRVHLAFCDERMVPPDHADSNFRLVWETLASRVDIPRENLHRIPGESDPLRAAEAYDRELGRLFSHGARLDLAVLGIGEDGHTASLFPGAVPVHPPGSHACAVFVPRLSAWRVTLTPECINTSRQVLFYVAGDRKKDIVLRLLGSPEPPANLPATLIRPVDGELTWMLDGAASALLPSPHSESQS